MTTKPATLLDGTIRLRGIDREAWEALVRIASELGAAGIATSERELAAA